MSDTDPRPHFSMLDGVRGLAVVLVVISHAMRIVPRTWGIDRIGWQALAAGWIGVDLFFVLSGFLITGILLDSKRRPEAFFLNFYARRFLRIAPLYYGFLAIYFYVLPRIPLDVFQDMAIPRDVRPMLWLYLYNFWGAVHQQMHGNVGVFWSLCVEEHFYLLWPMLVWMLDRVALKRVCVVLALMSFVARLAVIRWFPNDHAAYLLTPCRLDGLCAGALVAICLRDARDWRRVTRWARVAVPASACFVLGMAMGQRHFSENIDFRGLNLPGVDSSVLLAVGLSALAILFSGLIVLCVRSHPPAALRWVFENRALRSLGLYSYAIYIFHPIIVKLTSAALESSGWSTPQSPWLALPARLAVATAVLLMSFTLAFASYHLFEKHFLALKRYFPPAQSRSLPEAPHSSGHGDFEKLSLQQ